MANMCAITFEMMAEVNNKKMLDEDEFSMCVNSNILLQGSIELM
jgi:hypothetical protein